MRVMRSQGQTINNSLNFQLNSYKHGLHSTNKKYVVLNILDFY